jgi:hypothetical protein
MSQSTQAGPSSTCFTCICLCLCPARSPAHDTWRLCSPFDRPLGINGRMCAFQLLCPSSDCLLYSQMICPINSACSRVTNTAIMVVSPSCPQPLADSACGLRKWTLLPEWCLCTQHHALQVRSVKASLAGRFLGLMCLYLADLNSQCVLLKLLRHCCKPGRGRPPLCRLVTGPTPVLLFEVLPKALYCMRAGDTMLLLLQADVQPVKVLVVFDMT